MQVEFDTYELRERRRRYKYPDNNLLCLFPQHQIPLPINDMFTMPPRDASFSFNLILLYSKTLFTHLWNENKIFFSDFHVKVEEEATPDFFFFLFWTASLFGVYYTERTMFANAIHSDFVDICLVFWLAFAMVAPRGDRCWKHGGT